MKGENKKNRSGDGDLEILGGSFLTWFIGMPLIYALLAACIGLGMWLIDLLPGPGWLAAIIIVAICILYGWWDARRD